MPYKCVNCDKLVQKKSQQECSCDNPNFLKTELLHYIHEEGKGTVEVHVKDHIGVSGTKDEKIIETKLLIACNATEKTPIITRTKNQVTCIDCLQFIDSLPKPEEEDDD